MNHCFSDFINVSIINRSTTLCQQWKVTKTYLLTCSYNFSKNEASEDFLSSIYAFGETYQLLSSC